MRSSIIQLLSLFIFLIAVVMVLLALYFGFRDEPTTIYVDDNQTTSSHYEREDDQQYDLGVDYGLF